MEKLNNYLNIQQELDKVLVIPTIYNFIICILFSFLLKEIYIRKSQSFSGKLHIGNIIPVLSAGIFIVITVVKSSLALSLGLVGALSIVRFRTPVKEPEDLIYLFLSISIGLGYGSGNTLITTILFLLTMVLVTFNFSKILTTQSKEYNLIINLEQNIKIDEFLNFLKRYVQELALIRLEEFEEKKTLTLSISVKNYENLNLLFSEIKKIDQKANITFFENNSNW